MTSIFNSLRRGRFSIGPFSKPEIKRPDLKTDVPQAIFLGYLFGGRTWPQTRGGINVSLLHKWGTVSKGNHFDLLDLASSQLNPKQIKIDKSAMKADHSNAGIVLTVEITDALMQNEWLKAKHAALISIAQLVQKKYEKDVVPITEKEIVQYAKGIKLNEQDFAFLKEEVAVVYDLVFKQHLGLARLFSLTLFEEKQRDFFYYKESGKFDEISDSYGIPQFRTRDVDTIQELSCKKITEILQRSLSKTSPMDWITWGFENKHKKDKGAISHVSNR